MDNGPGGYDATLFYALDEAETEEAAAAIFDTFDATEIEEIIKHIRDRQCSKLP